MQEYIHIFTDGLDRLLSASVWFPHYGKKDSFLYYEDGKLKGYVSKKEIEELAEEGYRFLHDESNVIHLLTLSDTIAKQVAQLDLLPHNENDLSETELANMTKTYAKLLEDAYSLYFATEEFCTSQLDPKEDALLIDKIGKYRLSFMETNIKATENLFKFAKLLGAHVGLLPNDVEFLTVSELINYKRAPITNISEREECFFMEKDSEGKIIYESGLKARDKYHGLFPEENSAALILEGMGASVGIVSGEVYILSLAEKDKIQAIANMPQDAILVTESTQPDLVLACNKAIAIITNEGGILSHAAIISRELKIPCVVGTRRATEILHNGQRVEVDGELGIVKILS